MRRTNGNATAYGVAHENRIIAYPQRKWRMHSVQPTYARRSTRFYGVWRAYAKRMGCIHAAPRNTAHFFVESFYRRDSKGENCECDRESKCHALIQSADEEAEGEIRQHKTRPLLMRHSFGLQLRYMHPTTRTCRVMLKTL